MKQIESLFHQSKKNHLLITGTRGSGKSTFFSKLCSNLPIVGIKTKAIFTKHTHPDHITLTDLMGEHEVILASFANGKMNAMIETFETVGVKRLLCDSLWIGIDEIGFLEQDCPKYQAAILSCFDHQRVIAVIKKEKETPLIKALKMRNDVFLVDLDLIKSNIDCVIMASGHSKRFHSNKLLAIIENQTLIEWTLKQIPYDLLNQVVLVTRYDELEEIAKNYPVKIIRHEETYQNSTIALGLSACLLSDACFFLTCDQPYRDKASIIAMIRSSMEHPQFIYRLSYQGRPSNPVLFPQCTYQELMSLKHHEKGTTIIHRHLDLLRDVEARSFIEVIDIDTQADLEKIEAMK